MITPLLLLLAFIGPVIAVGVPLVWRAGRGPRFAAGPPREGSLPARLGRARDALVAELGPTAAAVLIGLAGVGAMLAVCWPVGGIAASLEAPLDRPFFAWMQQIYDSQGVIATVVATVVGDHADG